MIFFTADTHFGHEMIAKVRGFACLEDHDFCLIDNINRRVKRHDSLVICGDFGLPPGRYRPQIWCKHIFFVLGNHDVESKIRKVFGGHVWQQKMIKLSTGDQVFACHYPLAFWDKSHYGSICLYAHLHDNAEFENMMDKGLPKRRSMDIGVDVAKRLLGNYEPFSEQEILEFLAHRPGHEENWREIPGYESSYEASTQGRIRSLGRMIYQPNRKPYWKPGKILKQTCDKDGYKIVGLCKNSIPKLYKVHRLVLSTFKGQNEQQVLHGRAGKSANFLANLKYGTHQENWEDRRRDGTDLCKPVVRSDGKKYSSLTEAAEDNNCLIGSISNVCRKKSKQAAGYSWEYINE